MAIFRVEKNSNYTSMSNYHLRDTTMTLKAIGLLSKILSLPDDWDYSVRGLVAICKEGKDCIVAVLQELEEHGYLERRQLRRPDGKMGGTEYVIFEQPHKNQPCMEKPCVEIPCTENPDAGNPDVGNPDVGKPDAENTPQLSTNLSSTKQINYERIKTVRHEYGQYENVRLSAEEYTQLACEFPGDYEQRIERLSEYMASTGKSYKNHLATIRNWAQRESGRKSTYGAANYQFKEGDSL